MTPIHVSPERLPPEAVRLKPRWIALEASSHCQLRCPSCPTALKQIDAGIGRGFLRLSDFRSLLDSEPDLLGVEISNFGEIFLNPELVGILELAYERRVTIMAHNGVNLNDVRPEVLEALVRYRVHRLTVSIDGATQGSYVQYRRRGDLETVIGNIRTINRWKAKLGSVVPHLRWQFIVFGHNEHEIEDARSLAEELGMEFFVKLSYDDDVSPIRDADVVRAAVGAVSRSEFARLNERHYIENTCNQLWDIPQFNYDGRLLGCCINYWSDLGANLFTGGLEAALNSEPVSYARMMLQGEAPPRIGIPCTSCDVYAERLRTSRWLKRPEGEERS